MACCCKNIEDTNRVSWECHTMIKQGELNPLERYINLNFNPDIKFQNETLLATAIKSNSLDIVHLLLINGANPNLRSLENGRLEPPLVIATRRNLLFTVQLLLDKGADISRASLCRRQKGRDAMFHAVDENACKILELLLERSPCYVPSHQLKNCPLLHALKFSENLSFKRKCLRLVMSYKYECGCFRTFSNSLRFIPFDGEESPAHYNLSVSSDSSFRVCFGEKLTLKNLARTAIRRRIYHIGIGLNFRESFYKLVEMLPLSPVLIEFILYKNIDDIIVRKIVTLLPSNNNQDDLDRKKGQLSQENVQVNYFVNFG